MKKMFSSLLLILVLLISANFSSFASEASCIEIKVDENTVVYATIPRKYIYQISEDELLQIAIVDNLKNGDRINIEEIGLVSEEISTEQMITGEMVQPLLDWNITHDTTRTLITANVVMADDFIISVARGETAELSKRYTNTIKQEISGSYYKLTTKLTGSVTCTYEITKTWTGPSENATNVNSREFRVKYLGDKYSYSQSRYIDGYHSGTKSGTVIIPTKYASYSIDSYQ